MIAVLANDGNLFLDHNFLGADEATSILQQLVQELTWSRESIRIYGKTIRSPRLVSWVGDKEAIYTYSGIEHHPLRWHPLLTELRTRLEKFTGQPFNSVLCNWYRDGSDSLGWHADKEPELGSDPYLVSLSLGDTRTFKIRHRKTGETHRMELNNGSLITMSGKLQQYWRHSIPKTRKPVKTRVNLSFRKIIQGGYPLDKR